MIKRIILLCLSLIILGCGDQSAKLVGRWSDGAGGSFEFLKDYTLVIKDNPGDQNPVAGKWYALSDGSVKIDIYTHKGRRIVAMAFFQDDDHLIMDLKDKHYSLTREKS